MKSKKRKGITKRQNLEMFPHVSVVGPETTPLAVIYLTLRSPGSCHYLVPGYLLMSNASIYDTALCHYVMPLSSDTMLWHHIVPTCYAQQLVHEKPRRTDFMHQLAKN